MSTATLLLGTGTAAKIGPRGTGLIHYQLTTNDDRSKLWVSVTGNDGGGYFSRESVAIETVISIINVIDTEEAFGSQVFKLAFVGRSSNNAGFLAAILRAEGVLSASPERVHLHHYTGDIEAWRNHWLKQPGEPLPVEAASDEVEAAEPEPSPEPEPIKKRRGRKRAAADEDAEAADPDAS